MVTTVLAVTFVVVIVNGADEVCPAFTVTLAGTIATAGFELVTAATTPDGPAGPVRVTTLEGVDPPPITVEGDRVKEAGEGGVTVNGAVFVTPPYDAEIVTSVIVSTAPVVIVNCGE